MVWGGRPPCTHLHPHLYSPSHSRLLASYSCYSTPLSLTADTPLSTHREESGVAESAASRRQRVNREGLSVV